MTTLIPYLKQNFSLICYKKTCDNVKNIAHSYGNRPSAIFVHTHFIICHVAVMRRGSKCSLFMNFSYPLHFDCIIFST